MDASSFPNGNTGAPFYMPELIVEQLFRLPDNVNIYDGELFALRDVILHAYKRKLSKVCFITDCVSALQALVNNPSYSSSPPTVLNIKQLLYEYKDNILNSTYLLIWCPSHNAIVGNLIVDTLDKQVTLLQHLLRTLVKFSSPCKNTSFAKCY